MPLATEQNVCSSHSRSFEVTFNDNRGTSLDLILMGLKIDVTYFFSREVTLAILGLDSAGKTTTTKALLGGKYTAGQEIVVQNIHCLPV